MPRDTSPLQRALGQLLTAIQREETRALGGPDWSATHAVLVRAENLYWAHKRRRLDLALDAPTLREYLGVEWMSAHPRVLEVVRQVEHELPDFTEPA